MKSNSEKPSIETPIKVAKIPFNTGRNICCKHSDIRRLRLPIEVKKLYSYDKKFSKNKAIITIKKLTIEI